ncbi:N-formylglutamate amidohydrolase [Novosphingobium sp. Chol11]|uniref:N-formylglutamate amidohydrolase n=1 Tax=Novosphingobium sp. Chol11 TaxID=1385763 RepID=UPI0025CF50E3|nr:N-formylglutamate amidohydrolase [Novosphingobium sp. Chol11]
MSHPDPFVADSPHTLRAPLIKGGNIAEGASAFSFHGFDPAPIPVVIAVPHAGRTYPQALLENMRHPAAVPLRLEDRYVDLMAMDVAHRTGAGLLIAHAPRAMIDLNRSVDDIDWEMIQSAPGDGAAPPLAQRARSGLGLIPRRLPGTGEIWKRRLDRAELDSRIALVHAPYHAALAASLEAVRARWGAALLIDLHSMPSLSARNAGEPAAEFVIGDRFGASCEGMLVAAVFSYFAEMRRLAAHNRPYAGAYVLDRHVRLGAGVHCLQIEIDRRAYLDAQMSEPGPGFTGTASLLAGLVQRIAALVGEMGQIHQRWPAAAE